VATAERTFPLIPRHRVVGHFFGTLRSGRRGVGSDVAGSRLYRAGDDIDTIDWGASAKLASARGVDDFVVRVHHAEEAPCAIVVCDYRPSMAHFARPFPWLVKHEAMRAAAHLVGLSVARARGMVGYLDYAEGGEERWEVPRTRTETRVERAPERPFRAPGGSLTTALLRLVEHRRAVPPGSFVFMLSDFLAPPTEAALTRALQQRWDIVPVVIQDPVWEQSFPDVSGVVIRLVDPDTGRVRDVRLTRGEVAERRAENEERFAELLRSFDALDLDPIVVSTADGGELVECFMAWSDQRRLLVGRRRL
jgi:uncharacterized protein (DUF58 family)